MESKCQKISKLCISYRLRIGDYRILFERVDFINIIDIIDIRHRKKVMGENKMFLQNYQIIKENGENRFAVVDYDEFMKVKKILDNPEELEDFLDYLHIQKIKIKNEPFFSIDEVYKEFNIV